MEQVCNTVMIPREEYDALKQQRDERIDGLHVQLGLRIERIKELEASLASIVQGVRIDVPTHTMEQAFQSYYRRGYAAGKAALRQRIDDQREAYIIACENEKCGEVEEYGKGWDAAILACVKAIRARGI